MREYGIKTGIHRFCVSRASPESLKNELVPHLHIGHRVVGGTDEHQPVCRTTLEIASIGLPPLNGLLEPAFVMTQRVFGATARGHALSTWVGRRWHPEKN